MKALLAVFVALSLSACAKSEPAPLPQTPVSSAVAVPAPSSVPVPAAPSASTAPTDAPVASSAPSVASAPSAAGGHKGPKDGKVVLFGFQSSEAEDKGICWAIVGKPQELADFNKDRKKNTALAAKKLKAGKGTTFLESCPSAGVVGTCESAFGLLVDYYAPTFTLESAKAHCKGDQMGQWIE